MARERGDPPVAPLSAPLVLTAELDPATQAWLDGLRKAHFPPERNHLRAHLTLFHALPERPALPASPVLDAMVEAPFKLGRGVAFAVACPGLGPLRAGIAAAVGEDALTRQDRGWGRPHVTVQNKVAPEAAAALHAELSDGYEPRPAQVVGLSVWEYRGGPWSFLERAAFS